MFLCIRLFLSMTFVMLVVLTQRVRHRTPYTPRSYVNSRRRWRHESIFICVSHRAPHTSRSIACSHRRWQRFWAEISRNSKSCFTRVKETAERLVKNRKRHLLNFDVGQCATIHVPDVNCGPSDKKNKQWHACGRSCHGQWHVHGWLQGRAITVQGNCCRSSTCQRAIVVCFPGTQYYDWHQRDNRKSVRRPRLSQVSLQKPMYIWPLWLSKEKDGV